LPNRHQIQDFVRAFLGPGVAISIDVGQFNGAQQFFRFRGPAVVPHPAAAEL
jgi:hypothetical protein